LGVGLTSSRLTYFPSPPLGERAGVRAAVVLRRLPLKEPKANS
jgi:hypothetical protein